jgi:type I restriction enzyme S subunit
LLARNAWEKRKLREVSDVRDGTHASPKYYSQGYPLVTSKNLTSAGLDFSNISLISELDYKNINKRSRVDKGDILFGMIGTIGTPVMVHESNFAIKNVALIKEREAVLNSFLVQLLKSPAFINYIRNENVGGTQKFLSLNTIRNFRFSFPTSKEQAMVSRFLEKIDSLIAATQDKIDALEQAKRALLQRLFDQSWRFKGYSDPWEKRKLREVSDVRDGTHASPKYYSQGYPLVTSKNLTSAGLDFSNISLISELDYKNINKRSRVDKGDILFGMIGTIGTPVMVHESNFAIKNVALIKEREAVLNSFLVQLLKSPAFINYIRNENVGGTQKFLSLNTIRNFRFSFPTSKEQAMVSRFLEKIDSLIAATQSRLSSLELLKKALLQDLFI